MKTILSFSDVVDGYLLTAKARPLSEHTVADYVNAFRKFLNFYPEDPPYINIAQASANRLIAFPYLLPQRRAAPDH